MYFKLNEIRAAFATWLCGKGFYHTLALAAQASFRIDPKMESLASITMSPYGFSIAFKPGVLALYDANPLAMFFLIMHELRHIRQFQAIHQQDQLLSLLPIDNVILEKAPLFKKKLGFNANRLSQFKAFVINIAADAALHEDLIEIFGREVLEDLERFDLETGLLAEKVRELITVERLNKDYQLCMNPKQDWLYYAREIVEAYARHLREDEKDLLDFLSGALAPGLPDLELDDHLGSYSFRLDEILMMAEQEKKRLLEAEKVGFAYADPEPGDNCEIFENRRLLNERIKAALSAIEAKVRRMNRADIKEAKSFGRPSRIMKGLPGMQLVHRGDCNAVDALIIDVSGSMWTPIFIEQMLSLGRHLAQAGRLRAIYSCDVVLKPLPLRSSGMIDVQGGGGTVWSRAQHEQLLKDFGVKDGLRVIYCTDEAVMGLEDALQDERVELSIMNIPNLLKMSEGA